MRRHVRVLSIIGAAIMAATCHAIEPEFIALPAVMHPMVQGVAVEELAERYAAGDAGAVAIVDAVLERAAQWQAIDAQWWLDRVLPVTPIGMWTTACPIHPERCQDFSDVSWRWSLDEPFRLYCPLCEEEGREYPYYPNPDYPDDGTGCYPTDEVWRRTHGPEWSREHPGIPWDRWDGQTHGYSSAGYAFFFRGKWHHEANGHTAGADRGSRSEHCRGLPGPSGATVAVLATKDCGPATRKLARVSQRGTTAPASHHAVISGGSYASRGQWAGEP